VFLYAILQKWASKTEGRGFVGCADLVGKGPKVKNSLRALAKRF
jgi:hypothetical protein